MSVYAPQNFQNPTNVPQSLPELIELYKATEVNANLDLSAEKDYRTLPGLELRKNGAIQALPGIRNEIVRLVEQNSGAIFLSGTAAAVESFIGEVQDLTEGAVVALSAREIYEFVAKEVDKGFRRDRKFSMDCINSYTAGIIKMLDLLSVDGIPQPNLTGNLNKVFPDLASVSDMVETSLNSMTAPNGVKVGDGLNAIYLQLRAAEEGVRESIATPFLPVIILNATPEETEGTLFKTLFFGRNVAFEASEEGKNHGKNAAIGVLKGLKAQHPKGKAKKSQ